MSPILANIADLNLVTSLVPEYLVLFISQFSMIFSQGFFDLFYSSLNLLKDHSASLLAFIFASIYPFHFSYQSPNTL